MKEGNTTTDRDEVLRQNPKQLISMHLMDNFVEKYKIPKLTQ